jgi:NADH-quinone oxidoreductase subunit C
MDANTLVASLQDAAPGAQIEGVPSVDLQTTIYVSREDLPAIARALKDRSGLRFDLLAEITAVDFWPREPRFELVYILVSIPNRLRLRMKVRLSGADPRVATMSGVWPAANWLEREVFDMFGIRFDGHPDLRRILMPDEWQGHPQRKDYPLEGPGELLMENPMDWLRVKRTRDGIE